MTAVARTASASTISSASASSGKKEQQKTPKSSITTDRLPPVTPGELLQHEFLEPMGVTPYRLARSIGVCESRVYGILRGQRTITADTDLRLCRLFGLGSGYWLRAQALHDLEVAAVGLQETLKRIVPLQ